jgi:hypothetical protein
MTKEYNIHFSFDWIPVLQKNGFEYHFPENPDLIEEKVNNPSIYKWTVYFSKKDDLKIIYIGETDGLFNRIKGYINPGPTQGTNIRINNLFKNYLTENKHISLETLKFNEININNTIINYKDLNDKNIRKSIENLFIAIYKRDNYILLNKG